MSQPPGIQAALRFSNLNSLPWYGVLLLFAASFDAAAQDKAAMIPSVEAPPQIDGVLSPGEWNTAAIIDDFLQMSPVEFADPSQRTVLYVKFDENHLYIAAHCFDTEPDRIVAQNLRQGSGFFRDDHITVIVDPFNNKRSGFFFEMNSNGVREEGIFTNGISKSDDWDGIWRGAARVVEDGWTVEIEIPFKTLSFEPDNSTWGFNVIRRIPRTAESVAWTSRAGRANPTAAGELTGFEGMSQGMGLDVIPSASATSVRGHADDSNDSEFRPSLDVNYKVTPSTNLVLTINTDFAATEVDQRQLDLTRFSLFFPEKRTFFLTDFDIFQFGGITQGGGTTTPGTVSGPNGLAFFSRRIGLSEDREPVDLTGGLKYSGRIGALDFGTLYVRQDEYEDVDASDLYVARAATGVLEESAIGAIFTHGDPASNETSWTSGLDFAYRNTRFSDNQSLEGFFWVQKTENENLDGDDMAWNASFGMPAREGLELGAQYHEVQANYDPRLGFAARTGVRLYSGRAAYKWVNEDSYWTRRVDSALNYRRWEYLDTGLLQTSQVVFTPLLLRNASDDVMRLRFTANKERLLEGENPLDALGIDIPPGEYSFDRYEFYVGTAGFRPLAVELRVNNGDYYNGKLLVIEPEIEWRINEHIGFELEYEFSDYDFPDARAITRQITLDNYIAFNPYWSLLTLAQYDNLSDDIGINMRLRYNRAAGQDFWVVLNHNLREYQPGDPEFRANDDSFRSVETRVAVKLRYTFRF